MNPPRLVLLVIALLGACLICPQAAAVLRLPSIISEHMVLQRAARVPLWGWAAPGAAVSVNVGEHQRHAVAAADGRWQVEFDLAQAPATPLAVAIRAGAASVRFHDVVVGEVWLAAGQSNMEISLRSYRAHSPMPGFAAAPDRDIRIFKVKRRVSSVRADDVTGAWVKSRPAVLAAGRFSAVAYFVGARLAQQLRTPVGVIDSSWGATRVDSWTPASFLVRSASRPVDPDAAQRFNGQIAGMAPFALKGFLWYQGESDVSDHDDIPAYTRKLTSMISGWRHAWNRQAPFYYVQLAPYAYHLRPGARVMKPSTLPLMWEAQADALAMAGTAMVVTTDLADDLRNIHPHDKATVGYRLANLALQRDYGFTEFAVEGPLLRTIETRGRRLGMHFDHAQGLRARDGKALTWFEVAGRNGRYYPARAVIENGVVWASSRFVDVPQYARFAWNDGAQPNLVNAAGLPARPFRSVRPAQGGQQR